MLWCAPTSLGFIDNQPGFRPACAAMGSKKDLSYAASVNAGWTALTGGRAIYQGHVFGLTAVTYPEEGWDYIECLNRADHPTTIIVGDHDFLDMGNGLMKEWIKPEMKIDLRILEKAGHILWIDQPQIFEQEILLGLKK